MNDCENPWVKDRENPQEGTGSLSKSEHGQLLVAENWFEQHYPSRKPIRVILHHNNKATKPAMAQGTIALTFEGIQLTAALRTVLQEVCLSVGSSAQRLKLCDALLRKTHLTFSEIISEYFTPFEVG